MRRAFDVRSLVIGLGLKLTLGFGVVLGIVFGVGGAMALSSCDPVKMPYEMPGPLGAGKRDPRESGPSTLSIAQQTTLRNQGMPLDLVENQNGGKTWIYVRQAGSVFGEQETAEMYVFDDRGLLVKQETELRRYSGK